MTLYQLKYDYDLVGFRISCKYTSERQRNYRSYIFYIDVTPEVMEDLFKNTNLKKYIKYHKIKKMKIVDNRFVSENEDNVVQLNTWQDVVEYINTRSDFCIFPNLKINDVCSVLKCFKELEETNPFAYKDTRYSLIENIVKSNKIKFIYLVDSDNYSVVSLQEIANKFEKDLHCAGLSVKVFSFIKYMIYSNKLYLYFGNIKTTSLWC